MQIEVRDATREDVERIREIYNDVVATTTAIWNEETVDTANREAWFTERRGAGFPVLVATDSKGEVLGYATFGPFRAFGGYRLTVEHSVHIHRDSRGKGAGTLLMRVLIQRATRMGKHVMIAAIEAENEASIRLHNRLGFEQAGRLKEVGTKFGKWLDLAFMQLILAPSPEN